MKLHDILKQHIKKANIPKLQDKILLHIHQHQSIEEKSTKRLRFNAFLALKLTSITLLIFGMSLYLMSYRDDQIYAFSAYDTVMMQATSTAYAIFETLESPIDMPVSQTTHISLVRQELKTMISYQLLFERWIVSNIPNHIKNNDDDQYILDFELQDDNNQKLPMRMHVTKQFKDFKKDEFSFEGQINQLTIKGETLHQNQAHTLLLHIQKGDQAVSITYDDKNQTFDFKITDNQTEIQSFSYHIDYDQFDRATVYVHYEKDGLTNHLVMTRSHRTRSFQIKYAMTSEAVTYQGSMNIVLKWMPKPRIDITLIFDDGQQFSYTFDRPQRNIDENQLTYQ
jgi:hypothetical protein